MNWILLGVIVFLAAMTVIGLIRGFSRMLLSLVSFILALVITWALTPLVKTLVTDHTGIDDGIRGKLTEWLSDNPDALENIEHIPIPGQFHTETKQTSGEGTEEALPETEEQHKARVDNAAEFLTNLILTSAIALLLFLLLSILIALLGKLLDLINRLPGFKQLNRLLGAILGLALGLVILELALLVLPVLGSTGVGAYILGEIGRSKLLTWLYQNNVMVVLFNLTKERLFGKSAG